MWEDRGQPGVEYALTGRGVGVVKTVTSLDCDSSTKKTSSGIGGSSSELKVGGGHGTVELPGYMGKLRGWNIQRC